MLLHHEYFHARNHRASEAQALDASIRFCERHGDEDTVWALREELAQMTEGAPE